MTTITAKIQILPTQDDIKLMLATFALYGRACNWLSKQVFETKILNQFTLHQLFYDTMRTELGTKAQMTQSVIKTVVARYKSAKANGHDWSLIEFSNKDYDLVWNRDYSLTGGKFSIGVANGRIKIPMVTTGMEKYFTDDYKWGTAKVVHKLGKWYLHIPVTKEAPTMRIGDISNVVGVDLGINFLATTYNSKGKTQFFNGKSIKHKRGEYKALRKALQQKQTPSARKRLKQIGQRENRYVTDINHQVTKALIENNPKGTVFVLEDLTGVRQATEKVQVKHRYVAVSWAFHQFRQFLTYKAKEHGMSVMTIDPKYTSQTCPKCGHTHKGNRDKKHHRFACLSCGYQSNDDRIGAMNIHRKGIELIAQSDPAVAVEQVSIAKGEVNRPKGVISLDIPTPQ